MYFNECTSGGHHLSVTAIIIRGVGSCFTGGGGGGGAALKGQHLCILLEKWGTWVNILNISILSLLLVLV